MVKHILKISSYPENEAFIYCPKKNLYAIVKIFFPLKCPCCGEEFKSKTEIKFVLRQNLDSFGF